MLVARGLDRLLGMSTLLPCAGSPEPRSPLRRPRRQPAFRAMIKAGAPAPLLTHGRLRANTIALNPRRLRGVEMTRHGPLKLSSACPEVPF